MKREKDKVCGLRIAYIGGGSRGWARGFMSDLAKEKRLAGTIVLYDIDKEAAEDNRIIGNALMSRGDVEGEWKFAVADSLKEALTGADFVVISILPGTFDEMESDVHTPEKYGIYQSVGDTVGPGGIVRALRTLPMYVEIAKAIKDYSPNAWVINYTNPMTLCVRTLYEIFPNIKAFGCCHEVFGTQKLLASMLADMEGLEGVPRDEIKINVLGINHFTWIDRASYKGMDLFPIYEKFVDKYCESGFEGTEKGHWMNDSFKSAERVKFDLFRRYGVIGAAGDRHLAEFVPGYWYLKDPETVKSWKFGLTTVAWRKDDLKKRLEKTRNLLEGREEFEIQETGEDGVRQIKALVGLGTLTTNVNLPNVGQMKNVPLGAVVETNAVFGGDSARPLMAGALPMPVQSLVSRQVFNQETVLKAGIEGDYEMAFRAFVNDPLNTASLSDSRRLFREMLDNTRKYLK